jgi:hypothetical protein
LANQRLVGKPFETPIDAVEQLGAVQAQDFGAAQWAIAQRTAGASHAAIEQAIDGGEILRTHILRPTWHFVSARDLRWMLELAAPRIRALAVSSWRTHGLNEAVFKKSNAAIAKALERGQHLTRVELAAELRKAGVDPGEGTRLGHLAMRAELDGIICSGIRRGKQFTYALVDQRAPHSQTLMRDEALRKLATRYFSTRGPATVRDFAWWSGLTVTEARLAAHSADDVLACEQIDDREMWSGRDERTPRRTTPSMHLLPNYDEFLVAYSDRDAMGGATINAAQPDTKRAIFANVIEIDGQIAGGWRRTLGRSSVAIELTLFRRLTEAEYESVDVQAKRYGAFVGLNAELTTAD